MTKIHDQIIDTNNSIIKKEQIRKQNNSKDNGNFILAYVYELLCQNVEICHQNASTQQKEILNSIQNQANDIRNMAGFNNFFTVGTKTLKGKSKTAANQLLEEVGNKNQGVSATRTALESQVTVEKQNASLSTTNLNFQTSITEQMLARASSVLAFMLDATRSILKS